MLKTKKCPKCDSTEIYFSDSAQIRSMNRFVVCSGCGYTEEYYSSHDEKSLKSRGFQKISVLDKGYDDTPWK